MTKEENSDIAIVSSKGQVVIPQALREKLGIKPKTKLIVYGFDDAIVMKKINLPDIQKELETIYKKVDENIAKFGELSEDEIEEIIQKHRRTKHSSVEGS
ncbi:MAG: SpoVT/AbrB family transcription regulator [Promethearchaeota archaeon CR_4]|nr:MAG: SpoVT/AbrB family transcription regulator [Candidatus Lokiarchaeota archaeon CR_4]